MYWPLKAGSRFGRVPPWRVQIIVLTAWKERGADWLFEHTHAAAAYELFDVIDKEAVCGDRHVVRFEHSAELAGLFEVEQDLAFAGRVEQNCVDLFEQRGVG